MSAAPEQPGGGNPPGPPGPGKAGQPDGPVLSLDRLSLAFGGLLALSELDLHVNDGEVVSIIGPNGPASRPFST